MTRTYVDRGGTFTDFVFVDGERLTMRKVPSDRAVIGDLARGEVIVGTTVATNALLEGKGVPTLLLVSEGFGDLPLLGDMSRRALFDPDARWPAPLCVRVVEVPGRMDAEGREIEPLRVPELRLDGVEAVAIALLHSGRNPAHELALAATLQGVSVALGHQVCPEVGYLARVETTLAGRAPPGSHAGSSSSPNTPTPSVTSSSSWGTPCATPIAAASASPPFTAASAKTDARPSKRLSTPTLTRILCESSSPPTRRERA